MKSFCVAKKYFLTSNFFLSSDESIFNIKICEENILINLLSKFFVAKNYFLNQITFNKIFF